MIVGNETKHLAIGDMGLKEVCRGRDDLVIPYRAQSSIGVESELATRTLKGLLLATLSTPAATGHIRMVNSLGFAYTSISPFCLVKTSTQVCVSG